MTRDYVLDQGFAQERARFSGMEALWDAGSPRTARGTRHRHRLEMPRGRRGRWLARRMDGRGAHVTAIDIDTRFVDQLASDSIEVRRVDIREDELPQAEFDLVHSRLVLARLRFLPVDL